MGQHKTKTLSKQPGKTTAKAKSVLFVRLDTFFDKRHTVFLGLVLVVNLIFSILFFDSNVSISGDDSDYIIYAYRFAHDFTWPGFRGALYPIMLSPFIALFGIRLILLKSLSVICILLMLFFLYKAFYKRIPSSILFFSSLLLSFNSYILFYESQTFSEPLFMLLQTVFLFLFFKFFIDPATPAKFSGKLAGQFLLIAFLALLITLTRTVGYIVVGVVVVYFLINKQWRNALYSLLACVVCFVLFNIIKDAVWPDSGSSYSINSYMVKDMYNPTKGMETFGGFITRFIQNAQGYLSRDLAKFLGIRSESTPLTDVSAALTIFFILLFIASLIIVWKRNKPLLFTGLYTLALCTAHFILLQANWQQERFMLVLYPFILLLFFAAIYYVLQKRKSLQFLFPLVFAIIFSGTIVHTSTKLKRHIPVLQHNLHGDRLYSFTPDWKNFILMSEWAAKNTPDSVVIASRKPSISSIYGNRDFTGIFSVPGVEKSTIAGPPSQENRMRLVINSSNVRITPLASYVQYVIIGPHAINEHTANVSTVYELNKDTLALFLPLLIENKIDYTIDSDNFLKNVMANENAVVYSPEQLFLSLQERKIRYMILASLRINPKMPIENNIINTLHRYLDIVSFKHPDIIKQECRTIGNSEPATLVELNTE